MHRQTPAPAAIDTVFGEADPPCDARKQRGKPSFVQLQTASLILRSFREEDVDVMAQLFANPDFMRSR
jgi:hypothetical protein